MIFISLDEIENYLCLRDLFTYIDMKSNTKQHVQRCTRVNRVDGGREKTENQR
jgi:hypothetical protein